MKALHIILAVFFIAPLIGEEKVKEDYTRLGLEGATKIEFNIPDIHRNQPYLSDASYRFTLTPNYTVWPFKEHRIWGESGISAGYVGVYDFYFGTKDSGPVISRKQNPLIYLFTEHPLRDNKVKFALGLGHESNGQFISNQKSHLYFETAFVDSIHGPDASGNNLKYYQYNVEDWASMGWNYLYTDWIFKRPTIFDTNAQLSFKIHLRWFFKHGTLDPGNQNLEDDVFYDPKLAGVVSIRDYDGFRYSLDWTGDSRHYNFWRENYLVYDPSFSIGLRHGYLGSEFRPSVWAKLYLKLLGSLPIFYQYDRGYGRDLSNYPYKFSSHAFGVAIGSI